MSLVPLHEQGGFRVERQGPASQDHEGIPEKGRRGGQQGRQSSELVFILL